MTSFDHSRPDFAPYGFTCERWTARRMVRPDRHNEIEINFLGEGSLTYLLGGRKVVVPAGRLAAFWAGVPHQIVESEGEADYYVATLPLAWFLQRHFPARLVQPLLNGRVLLDPVPDPHDPDRFHRWLTDLAAESHERRRPAFHEIEARLLRFALALGDVEGTGRGRAATGSDADLDGGLLSKAEQMATFLALRYAEPLTVADVGRHVGLHPNHAMTLFKRAFGTTLIGHLTQHRISHAQRLLVATDEKILDVALDSGFGSISRFNAAFRRACGSSPREYRKRHRG
jgi:AraC-like DNA-binding protein